jgi:hypothetical protein
MAMPEDIKHWLLQQGRLSGFIENQASLKEQVRGTGARMDDCDARQDKTLALARESILSQQLQVGGRGPDRDTRHY